VEVLCQMFPEAPLYTSVYDPETMPAFWRKVQIRTTFMQRLSPKLRVAKRLLPLYPVAFEKLDLSGYDLVLSSCSTFSKGVITPPETLHVCYCHNTTRFAWMYPEYVAHEGLSRLQRAVLPFVVSPLRVWDYAAAQRVDHYIANSRTTQQRIATYYRRPATIIEPPIQTAEFAGGDGTVSAVANGLVGTEVPLGIIPLGTANVLARELMIPVDLEQACTLLGGEHAVSKIDAMEVAGKIYLTQVGIGIDALMIRDTKDADKRRFRRVAYLWTMAARLVGFQPRRFTLAVDGVTTKTQAIQVLLANCGTLGQPPLRWGEGIRPDDGVIDVCVVRAQTVWHFLKIAWNVARRTHKPDPNVSYLKARREVRIETTHPLLAQADGEVIGESPLTVRVVGGAVRVVVPL